MFKKLFIQFVFSMLITGTTIFNVYAEGRCMPIGGVGMPNFVPQKDGTFMIVAPLTGSVVSAAGNITAKRETATGLEVDMEHYFMTEKGGFMHTKDLGILTTVPGKKGKYMIEITYHIQEESTSGVLKGFKGSFTSFGLVDLVKLKGFIRYSGEIC
ncbi:MAG: hypothetical protein COB30_004415 [Ectothiorhodospiraceae bacterium]|nr:hypothetical protein [Ectothiorhodospiraceae bacterium]